MKVKELNKELKAVKEIIINVDSGISINYVKYNDKWQVIFSGFDMCPICSSKDHTEENCYLDYEIISTNEVIKRLLYAMKKGLEIEFLIN